MTNPIKLIIADDEMLIRTGLKIMLEASGNVEVLALAESGRAAFEACKEHQPDVVLMDIRMPVIGWVVLPTKLSRRGAVSGC